MADVERGGNLNIDEGTTWDVLLAKWVEEHDDLREGTFLVRKSVIDALLIPSIGEVMIVRTSRATLAKLIDHCLHNTSIGVSRYESALTTLKVVTKWAIQREYLMREPFGTMEEVTEAISAGRKRIRNLRPNNMGEVGPHGVIAYSREDVPTWGEVTKLAKTVASVVRDADRDAVAARRAAAAVRLAAGTGLRECELLGLTVDDVDLVRGFVNLWRQVDRYVKSDLPRKYAPLKGSNVQDKSSPQKVHVWKKVKNDLEYLVKNAGPSGELFPKPSDTDCSTIVSWWERRTKVARETAQISWPMHMLRHHYGSYSTASREEGGMGLSYATVQKSMGHKNLKTTMDKYIHSVRSEHDGWVA
ncbi:MAG: tyrosine-type recombinase/integrase [Actinobacteria bacterium]|nr:tyrosine-type recombinase/integrase [Actinomycetota bacterium]